MSKAKVLPEGLQDELGRVVRNVWLVWAEAQPDKEDHPNWLVPWDKLPKREQQVDIMIALGVMAYIGARMKLELHDDLTWMWLESLRLGEPAMRSIWEHYVEVNECRALPVADISTMRSQAT